MSSIDRRSTRARRVRRVVGRIAALVGALSLATTAFVGTNLALIHHDRPVGHWRSAEAEAEFDRLYDSALDLLPEPTEVRDVATRFGSVRAYVFDQPEHADRAPLLLLPGYNAPAPTWHSSVNRLLPHRSVIVLDLLGHPGRSVQEGRISSARDQGDWLAEVLAALGRGPVHVAGFSFGGWLAATLALHHPDRVASLSLLDAPYVFTGVRPSFVVGGVVATFPLVPRAYDRWYTNRISGGSGAADSPVAALVDHGRRHHAMALPQPERLTPDGLAALRTPTLAVLAGDSAAHDPEAALAGSAPMPNLTVTIEPDASHALHAQLGAALDQRILDFAAAHEPE